MGEQHIVFEEDIAAADTADPLTGFFGALAPTVVPAGVSRIKQVKGTVTTDGTVLGASVFAVRLQGKGIDDAPQDFIIGAQGGQLITSNNVYSGVTIHDCNIKVTPGGALEVIGYADFDTGLATMGVELVFE